MLATLLQEAEHGTGLHAAKGKALRAETFAVYAATWLARRFTAGVVMAKDEKNNLERHVLPQLGNLPLTVVRPVHVRAVLAKAAETLSRETVRKIRGVVSRVLGAAFREELIAENPVARVEVPTDTRADVRERTILTDDEVRRFLAAPSVDLELKVLSVCSRVLGGMRTSELNRWSWAMVDREHFADVTIRRAKAKRGIAGRVQRLSVPEPMRPFLRVWWQQQGMPEDGPVFPARRGLNKGGFKRPRVGYAGRLRKALLRMGITRREIHADTELTRRADFHSFRRAFSTSLAEAGVNVQTAMVLANHSDARVHALYVVRSDAMRVVPAACVPVLPDAAQLAQAVAEWPAKLPIVRER
jgi:integrase